MFIATARLHFPRRRRCDREWFHSYKHFAPTERDPGACGRTRTYGVHFGTPDLQSGAFAAPPRMQIGVGFCSSRLKA